MSRTESVQQRVERERELNESKDIIARAHRLKDRFPHVWSVTERLRAEEWRLLSNVRNRRVLDYGCGKGDTAVALLKAGAYVDGIDIARSYIDECLRAVKGVGADRERYNFQVMDAHKLSFPNDSFDYVLGNGILHHLDVLVALSEVHRVLKPGGRAIFQEPLAGNPLLKLFRRLTPAARTSDERPFSESDLLSIEKGWQVESTYYGLVSAPTAVLTSILMRPWPKNPVLGAAEAADSVLSKLRHLRSWNQYVLLNLVKPVDISETGNAG